MNANRIFPLKLFRIHHHRFVHSIRDLLDSTNIQISTLKLRKHEHCLLEMIYRISYTIQLSEFIPTKRRKKEREKKRKKKKETREQGERFRLYRAFLNEIIENAETPRKLRCSRPRWDETRLMPGNWANFGKRQPETFAREKRQRERQGEGVVRHGTGPNFARSRVKSSKR